MVEIIKSIQQYEVDISKSEYAARKKAETAKTDSGTFTE